MKFERHKSEFRQPHWTRIKFRGEDIRPAIKWCKANYDCRYYWSPHSWGIWIEDPKVAIEFCLRFLG